MQLPRTTPRMPVFRPDIRSITAGLLVMLGIMVAAVWAVGVVDAVPALLLSGLVAGAVTGWLTVRGTRVSQHSDAALVGVVHAVVPAGFCGALLYLYILLAPADIASDLIAAGWGGGVLLFLASPLAVVCFGLEGVVGGAIGAAGRLEFQER